MKDTIELFDKERQKNIFNTLNNLDITQKICDEFNCKNLIELKDFIKQNPKKDTIMIKRIRKVIDEFYNKLYFNEKATLSEEFYNKIVAYIKSSPIIF